MKDYDVIVIGGGNSALEEAVSLTQFAKSITLVHQFDHFQGYAHAIKAATENPKISFMMESEVEEFVGEEGLETVRVRSKKDGTVAEISATGAVVFIGYVPSTGRFKDSVETNANGEIITDQCMATNVPGVFAVGDTRQKRFRQITTAVADGTIAALNAREYISA